MSEQLNRTELKWINYIFFIKTDYPKLSLVAQMVKICLQDKRPFSPCVGKIPWRRKWQPTLVFLPGESHGQRSLVDYSPWGRKELDMTEQLLLSLFLRGNVLLTNKVE